MVNKSQAQNINNLRGSLSSEAGAGMPPIPNSSIYQGFQDCRQDDATMYVDGVQSQMYNVSPGKGRYIQNTVRLRTLQYNALLTSMGYIPNNLLKRFTQPGGVTGND